MAIRRTRRVSHGRRKSSRSKTARRNVRRARKPRTRRHRKRTARSPRRRSFRRTTRRYRGGKARLEDAYSGRSLADHRVRIADPTKRIAHRTAKLATATNWGAVSKSLSGSHKSTTGKTHITPSHSTLTKAQAEAIKNQIAENAGSGIDWAPLEGAAGTLGGLIVVVGGMHYVLSSKKVPDSALDTLVKKYRLKPRELSGMKKMAEDEDTVTFRYAGRDYTIPRAHWNDGMNMPTAKAMAKAEQDAVAWDTKGMGRTSFTFKGKNEGFTSETHSLDDSGQMVKAEFTLDPGSGVKVTYGTDSEMIPLDELPSRLGEALPGTGKTVAQVMGKALGSSRDVDATTIKAFVSKGMSLDAKLASSLSSPEGGLSAINNDISDALTSGEGDVTSALNELDGDII